MKRRLARLLAALASLLTPAAAREQELTGFAGFYAKEYIGKPMANGQPYNPNAFTLACNDLTLGTCVYIQYTTPRGLVRTAHATVTDRGPAEHLRRTGRFFDLSWALFRHLESPRVGVIKITVQVIP